MSATVYLVGAGPGDPGLLTVAGAEVLRRAAVVVYDYLANPELLKLAPAGAELLYVGKSGNMHTKSQDEINQLLLEKAQELWSDNSPRVVVRLKGGDPYVFGRGGEEAEFLETHGVGFVEIPGITAGIAAPAYAGIPVTHRDFTSSVTLVTGHEKEGSGGAVAEESAGRVNYDALAKLDGTLVFYMGIKALATIVGKLLAAGMSPEMPAAVVRWGTRATQQTVTATVGTLVEAVTEAKLTAPAITIIGRVVALRNSGGVGGLDSGGALNWFENRPLFGQRVLVTRTRQQASDLSARLAELGAQVLEAPTIELAEPDDWTSIDQVLQHIPAFDWLVFTSANGVRATWTRLRTLGFDARHFGASSIAALGPATAEALEVIGITPDLVPEKFVGEELAAALKSHIGSAEIADKSFLLLRADIARPVLWEELEKAGGRVQDVAIYQTKLPDALPEEILSALRNDEIDWITFTSASTASNLQMLLDEELRQKVSRMKRASIGPITTAALKKLNWAPTLEAVQHDIAGLVAAITENCRSKK